MKVGLYAGSIFSPESGGGCVIENEILAGIDKCACQSRHSFYFYSTSNNITFNTIHSIHPLLKHRIKGIGKNFNDVFTGRYNNSSSRTFCAMIEENNPDVIFYLTPWAKFDVDIPYISIVWDLQHRLQPQFPEVSANGELERREKAYSTILPRANYIIAGTNAGKKEIERFYNIDPDRIKILPHPTPEWALNVCMGAADDIKKKYNLSREYLLYPAQFWSHKNHINLIKSLKILNFEHKRNFDLVLVGSDKGYMKHVKDFVIHNNLTEHVHLLGFVDNIDLIKLYKNAFAMTYASLFGPENNPPLEAFALGCPVIASNVSGSEEQLNDAAILVDGKNPMHIANAVLQLKLNNELRNQLIHKGQIRAQKWTSKHFALAFFDILNEFEKVKLKPL